jgi:REP element-mobilizing transposase RayT
MLTSLVASRMKEMIKEICFANEIEIISGSMNPDHVHLLMWVRGYFVVAVGNVSAEDIQKYIENQEIHHRVDNFIILLHYTGM